MSFSLEYEQGPIRPVPESRSLLIRTTRGCPWNRCEFCINYREMKFSVRSIDEIKQDILAAQRLHQGHPVTTCFLQDGDSLIMNTDELVEILDFLNKAFPGLKQISSYGRTRTLLKKSLDELEQIRKAGITRLYCGMESGSDQVLKRIRKGVTAQEIIDSGQKAKAAGMELSEFLITGLGGRELWQENARETARVLNAIDPDFIRIRSIAIKQGAPLEEKLCSGAYILQTEEELIREQQMMLQGLTGISSHYSHDHAINLLMEVAGKLPEEKDAMLETMEDFFLLNDHDRLLFTLARRLGHCHSLDEMGAVDRHAAFEHLHDHFMPDIPKDLAVFFHGLRQRVM